MRVPFGALAGFPFAADCREIAAYYGVTPGQIRRPGNRNRADILEARHALMWRLIEVRGVNLHKAARWMMCKPETVRDGAAAHRERIRLFHDQLAPKPAPDNEGTTDE